MLTILMKFYDTEFICQNLFDLTSCTDVSNKLAYKRARLWRRMQDVNFIEKLGLKPPPSRGTLLLFHFMLPEEV